MPDTDEGLTLEVSPDDSCAEAMAQTSRALLAHPTVRHEFQSGDLWLLSFDVSDKEGSDRFTASVQDTASGRMLSASGVLADPGALNVTPTSWQRGPTDEEFVWAVEAARKDEETGALLAAEGAVAYRPVPALANVAEPDGMVDRVITVGVRSDGGGHRVVGVRTRDGSVIPDALGRLDSPGDDCGVAAGPGCPSPAGAGEVRVTVTRGDAPLWDLAVVAPSASSGTDGSGVELRRVDYKGQRALGRAHLPIVTVETAEPADACAPAYRLWQHEDSCLVAPGDDVAAGIRVCSSAPSTILDSGVDAGDFRGVALWLDGDDLVIVSQLAAGWYRMVSEWRLCADGTIRPRFGIAATTNPCTWRAQVVHAYWRLDFDILGHANNLVQEHNDPPAIGTGNWHTTRYEVRRPRGTESNRFWRVRNVRSSHGYSLIPGGEDGEAGAFGVGDVWIVRYHDGEIDDGHGTTTDPALARAGIDRFVSGEAVERQDVVLWYAAHVPLAPGEGSPRVGPDLVPSNWRDVPATPERFGPLEPPARPS